MVHHIVMWKIQIRNRRDRKTGFEKSDERTARRVGRKMCRDYFLYNSLQSQSRPAPMILHL